MCSAERGLWAPGGGGAADRGAPVADVGQGAEVGRQPAVSLS